ncbi:MAG: hypothetical protein H7Z10_03395 [Gemmatimonadaceae bacterium]|nr:hypothetical protein [Acetobacteraceae bacterium]
MTPRVLLLLLSTAPAVAQERPATTPTRDVDVTYRAGSAEQPVTQRSRWSARDRMMRLDTPTPGVYVIVDYTARRMAMVNDTERAVLNLPPPPEGFDGQPNDSVSYIRRGPGQVAGLSCTNWETTDTQGRAALACFTDDGVLLEARRDGQLLVQAQRVAYGPLDRATFAVPPAYTLQTPDDPPGGRR